MAISRKRRKTLLTRWKQRQNYLHCNDLVVLQRTFVENTAGLLVDETRDTLHTTSASQTADSRLGDTLDVITRNLATQPHPYDVRPDVPPSLRPTLPPLGEGGTEGGRDVRASELLPPSSRSTTTFTRVGICMRLAITGVNVGRPYEDIVTLNCYPRCHDVYKGRMLMY